MYNLVFPTYTCKLSIRFIFYHDLMQNSHVTTAPYLNTGCLVHHICIFMITNAENIGYGSLPYGFIVCLFEASHKKVS